MHIERSKIHQRGVYDTRGNSSMMLLLFIIFLLFVNGTNGTFLNQMLLGSAFEG